MIKNIPIGETTLHISDGNYSSKYPKKEEFRQSGVPFVSSNNLTNGRIVWDNMKYISEQQHQTLRKGHLKTGDVLLVTRGNGTGGTAYVTAPFENANINAQLVLLRADNISIDHRYLFYVISSPDFFKAVNNYASGTAQPQLPIGPLKKIPIPIRDISTQRKIAAILSVYDDLIENNSRRIHLLETMAQALYREWFINFRFPGHEQVKQVKSPLGMIPEGWEVAKVEDLYKTTSGGTPSRKVDEYFGGSINWVKTQELRDGYIFETDEKITELGMQNSSARLVPKNSVLVAMYGATIGQLGILAQPATMNQACCALISKEPPFSYAYAFLSLLIKRSDLIGLRQGAAQQNISQIVIRNFQLLKPTKSVLEKFNSAVEPMFSLIRNLQQKNQQLRQTRDLLLPKLISGEVDVSALDINTAALAG
jgi:type I restriction enzyme, S subunit